MSQFYSLEVAGLKRDLQLFPVSDDLYIAAFILFGDVELTVRCAEALLKLAPDYDVLVTAEAKSIPLIHEMARQSGHNEYVVVRKGPKVYMEHVLYAQVDSITTAHKQTMCIGQKEIQMLKGKRALIVDDVISTGESLHGLETLVTQAGGIVAGKMAVLAEGDAYHRDDITVLGALPLFHSDGSIKTC